MKSIGSEEQLHEDQHSSQPPSEAFGWHEGEQHATLCEVGELDDVDRSEEVDLDFSSTFCWLAYEGRRRMYIGASGRRCSQLSLTTMRRS